MDGEVEVGGVQLRVRRGRRSVRFGRRIQVGIAHDEHRGQDDEEESRGRARGGEQGEGGERADARGEGGEAEGGRGEGREGREGFGRVGEGCGVSEAVSRAQ